MSVLILICLQSTLLVAAACGIRHQLHRLQASRLRERSLIRRLDDLRSALRAAHTKSLNLDKQRTELVKQLARENSLRVFAEARLRTQLPSDDILLKGVEAKPAKLESDFPVARTWTRSVLSHRPVAAARGAGRRPSGAGSSFADTLVMPL